jgi:uncharacterized surface protein with fasciclin (FAS1) repeats
VRRFAFETGMVGSMKHPAIAGFATGAAMMVGGALAAVSTPSSAPPPIDPDAEVMNPDIGGQAMLPERDTMANLTHSPMHTKLVAALEQSGVAGALKADGQFTLFAPTDAAFRAGDKAGRERRLRYLIVPGKYDSGALLRVINENGGEAKLRTLEGGVLKVRMNGPTNILVTDERGNAADIAIYDIHDRNGVIQVIDGMIEPGPGSRELVTR